MDHDAGVHGGEVELGHVLVQAGRRGVDQAALVGGQQVDAALERFGLALLPRDEHAAAPGGGDLHGADAGAGRDAGDGLHRQAGQAGDLDRAVQPVVVGQEGVAMVDVPAAEEQMLLVAEDDAAVGEVGAGILMGDGSARIAVEGQRDTVVLRKVQQARQQVGVAEGGDDQIGVVALEQVAHAEQQAAAVAAGEDVLAPVDLDHQVGVGLTRAAAGVGRVALGAERRVAVPSGCLPGCATRARSSRGMFPSPLLRFRGRLLPFDDIAPRPPLSSPSKAGGRRGG